MIKTLSSLIPKGDNTSSDMIQSPGVVGTSLTVAANYTKFTTGANAVALSIANPTDTTIVQRRTISITQGATARVVTITGSSVVSSGATVINGTALPNSGPNKTDRFVFEWDGTAWECVDLRFDVR